MRSLKIFCLSIICATVFTACQCSKKNLETHSGTVRLNLSDDPSSLDPRKVRSLRDLTIVKQLFDGLMRLDEKGVPELAIANHYSLSEDQLTYTFTLREAYWTTGEPVTAYDFEYAWKQVINPSFGSDYAHLLYPIKNAHLFREKGCSFDEVGIQAKNDHTLIVQLEEPTPYFLELLAFPTFFPVLNGIDAKSEKWAYAVNQKLVSNGPFSLKKWKPQSDVILEKNPSYWDASEVKLKGLCFTILHDPATEILLYEKGELDWLGQPISFNIAPEILTRLKATGQLSSYPVAGTFWLKFNTLSAPFSNAYFRKALGHVLDRQQIITHLLQGAQTPASGPLPPSMALQSEPYFKDGDLKQARDFFEEGLIHAKLTPEKFPVISLMYTPTERNTKIAEFVQQEWQKAFGIQVELKATEIHVYRRLIKLGEFDIATGDWIADFNDPIAFLDLFKYRKDPITGAGLNDTGWEDKTYISYLDAAILEKDPSVRKQLLHAAEKRLVDEMPVAPLYHFSFDYAKSQSIENVILSPLGIADFKKTTVR